ncbi:hypothetical protein DIPPA_27820 [Diplonema papillatum]|nr:hypothetical protein DIPPA_27820 [Diplonema papillatum]|eukprot:gene12042-18600_t
MELAMSRQHSGQFRATVRTASMYSVGGSGGQTSRKRHRKSFSVRKISHHFRVLRCFLWCAMRLRNTGMLKALTRRELTKGKQAYDTSGGIRTLPQVDNWLRGIGLQMFDTNLDRIATSPPVSWKPSTFLSWDHAHLLLQRIKKQIDSQNRVSDTEHAFMALGGRRTGEGVSAEKLRQVVSDFDLNLKHLDMTDTPLDYASFAAILEVGAAKEEQDDDDEDLHSEFADTTRLPELNTPRQPRVPHSPELQMRKLNSLPKEPFLGKRPSMRGGKLPQGRAEDGGFTTTAALFEALQREMDRIIPRTMPPRRGLGPARDVLLSKTGKDPKECRGAGPWAAPEPAAAEKRTDVLPSLRGPGRRALPRSLSPSSTDSPRLPGEDQAPPVAKPAARRRLYTVGNTKGMHLISASLPPFDAAPGPSPSRARGAAGGHRKQKSPAREFGAPGHGYATISNEQLRRARANCSRAA